MIILVIGPPASGKTSLAASQDSFRHIDLDKHLPTSLDLTSVSYKEARNKVVAELLSDIRGPTIFDDTFHLFSMRKPFMKKAAELGVGFGIFKLPECPLESLLDRNRKRLVQLPESSIANVYKSFENLRPSEEPFIIESFNQRLQVPRSYNYVKSYAPHSKIHQLDIELRRITHDTITSMVHKDKETISMIVEERNNVLKGSLENADHDRTREAFSHWVKKVSKLQE